MKIDVQNKLEFLMFWATVSILIAFTIFVTGTFIIWAFLWAVRFWTGL